MHTLQATRDIRKVALWLGAVDDLWSFGKPRGEGGPWKDTAVQAGQPSDPYLMTNYDRKSLTLSHDANEPVTFAIEIDFLGNRTFRENQRITVKPNSSLKLNLSDGLSAKWVRFITDRAATVSALLHYE